MPSQKIFVPCPIAVVGESGNLCYYENPFLAIVTTVFLSTFVYKKDETWKMVNARKGVVKHEDWKTQINTYLHVC